MKKAELVIVPSFGISHLVPAVEFAKQLITLDNRFSITVLIMPDFFTSTTPSITNSAPMGIHFINLPPVHLPDTQHGVGFFFLFIESFKQHVKNVLVNRDLAIPLAGLVVDMFTTTMIDVANQLSIPSYVYYTSGAAMLGLNLHLPTLDNQISTDFIDYPGGLLIPSFDNPVPPACLPSLMQRKTDEGYPLLLYHARKFRETKGIIVNSVAEFERKAIHSFTSMNHMQVYPVGPLLDLDRPSESQGDQCDKIIKWLDKQPCSSVIFLCFGSRGAFSGPQVTNIAMGLEKSGHRFLWSLRKPPNGFAAPTDYENPEEVLPEGFIERTEEKGFICGWAPQVEVLAHKAIGGFVSHCGWNSILESLWFGVPILTWPLYAEQKLNAFLLTEELKLAIRMRTDYDDRLVMPEEIESGVRQLMDHESPLRRKVKEITENFRKSLVEGESSFNSLQCLIKNLMGEG